MAIYQNVYAFNAGEFSRRLESRSDLQKYQSACRTLENFIALPYGGISNRPGTEYIALAKETDSATRLIPFSFSTSTNFLLAFSNTALRFFSNGLQVEVSSVAAWADTTGYVLGDQVAHNSVNYVCILAHTADDGATPGVDDGAGDNEPGIGTDAGTYWHALTDDILELPTPYLSAELYGVQYLQVKDFVYIAHGNHWPRRLVRQADDNWTVEEAETDYPALLDQNSETGYTLACNATTGTGKTLTATGHTPFTSGHIGSYWEISHKRADPWVRQAISANASSSSLWAHGTMIFKTTGTWNATVSVEEQNAAGDWEVQRVYDSEGDLNKEVTFTQDVPAFLRITVTNYTSNTNGRALLECQDPIQRGLVKVTGFTNSGEVTVDVIKALHSTSATYRWTEGAWSDERGFPGAICLHENRVWYGGTSSDPLRLWGSVDNDYQNYLLGITDTDAVDFTLSSDKNNRIQWMQSHRGVMIVGTSGGEFLVSSSSSETGITATSITSEQHTNHGSQDLQALLANDSVVFLQRVGRRVMDYTYVWESDGRKAFDMTLYAEHITLGNILQMAFSQQPASFVWAVTGDGTLICLTYDRNENILAWQRHVTEGEFESVAVIPGTLADEVWVTVKRTINGETKRYVERLEPYTMWHHMVSTDDATTDADLYLFSDCGLKITQTASTTVSGLDHLEGETVQVVADGAAVSARTVSSGAITLDSEASQISVGLPTTATVETLPVVGNFSNGSTRGKKGRLARAVADLYRTRSLGFTHKGASAAETNWDVIHFGSNNGPLDSPVPLFTGQKEVPFAGNHSREFTASFRANQGLPCTILALTYIWDSSEQK